MTRIARPQMTFQRGRGPAAMLIAAFALALVTGCGAPTGEADGGEAGDVTFAGVTLRTDASLQEILEYPDALVRAQRVAKVLQDSSPDDLIDLQWEFERANLNTGDREFELFGLWWARFDAPAAFAYCENNLRTEHPGVINAIVREWARTSPKGFLDSGYLREGATFTISRGELVNGLVVGWFESGRAGLEEWLLSQGDIVLGGTAFNTYGRMLVLRDGPEKALEDALARQWPEEQKRLLLAGVLTVVGHQNPRLALKNMKLARESGIDTSTFLARILFATAEHNPVLAIELAGKGESRNPERTRAALWIMDRWIVSDPDGMFQWLDDNEGIDWTDKFRAQALRRYAMLKESDLDWSEFARRGMGATSERVRWSLVTWAVQRWRFFDEAAAEAWMTEHMTDAPEGAVDKAREPITDRDLPELEKVKAKRLAATEESQTS